MSRAVLGLAVLLSACANGPASHDIHLVRHAEKAAGDDPVLTPVGKARALALAEQLSDAELTHIHSTDTRRTRLTAALTADATGLEVAIYDARDLAGFADALLAERGNHLVVGHSNTTPQLAEALGCGPQMPMPETEYDRIIIVRVEEERVACRVERFG